MKRILASLAAIAYVFLLLWVFGIDFSERGIDSGMAMLIATVAFGVTYSYPGWYE